MNIELIPETLIQLRNRDLEKRNELIEKGLLSDGYNEEMAKIHSENAKTLQEIMKQIGYPTIEKVGKEASDSAWLVIQHAIGEPDFMKASLKSLEKEVENGNADPIQLAYLSDRIYILEGKPQLYGTQFDWDENGELSPNKIDKPELVNERRKDIGLNTIEEQTQLMRNRAQSENQKAPKDFQKRQEVMQEWRKKVGWIK